MVLCALVYSCTSQIRFVQTLIIADITYAVAEQLKRHSEYMSETFLLHISLHLKSSLAHSSLIQICFLEITASCLVNSTLNQVLVLKIEVIFLQTKVILVQILPQTLSFHSFSPDVIHVGVIGLPIHTDTLDQQLVQNLDLVIVKLGCCEFESMFGVQTLDHFVCKIFFSKRPDSVCVLLTDSSQKLGDVLMQVFL